MKLVPGKLYKSKVGQRLWNSIDDGRAYFGSKLDQKLIHFDSHTMYILEGEILLYVGAENRDWFIKKGVTNKTHTCHHFLCARGKVGCKFIMRQERNEYYFLEHILEKIK